MRNDPIEHVMRGMLERNQSRWQRRPSRELGSLVREEPEREYVHTWKGGGYSPKKEQDR